MAAATAWLTRFGAAAPDLPSRPTGVQSSPPGSPVSRPAPDPGRPGSPEPGPEEQAREIVLRKLSVQARTRQELARALQAKDIPGEVAAAVLDRMTQVGLIDDAGFARDWVVSRQRRRHLSRRALQQELATKGVDREHIDEALTSVESEDEWDAAFELAKRRFRSLVSVPREVAFRRLAGVLARRGFSSELSRRVLTTVLDGAESPARSGSSDAT